MKMRIARIHMLEEKIERKTCFGNFCKYAHNLLDFPLTKVPRENDAQPTN